ncbi:MAG: DUF4870 domain-containing protein [Candidatus Omnitrophica bacterium]|jgi:hypothetical protein|nr:DUF4870 domain-containing protein [Candidatus Omnitrophota bacterium]
MAEAQNKQENNLAMACHLLGLIGFLGPLILWLVKNGESAAVDKNGKESLNFQISIIIYLIGAWLSAFMLIGFFLFPAVIIFNYVMVIIAAVKTSKGEDFKYPLCIRFIK